MSEKQEQIALFKRAQYHEITRTFMWATPNGGKRNPLEAKSLKLQGVKAGVPDILLAYPANGYHGLFIELKRPPKGGVLTADQAMMLDRLGKVGFAVHVCYGWVAAWEVIENYLKFII